MTNLIEVVFFYIVGLVSGYLAYEGINNQDHIPIQQIIEQGCGYYEPTTGEFKLGRIK